MHSSVELRARGLPLCGVCRGTGQDPQAPIRQTSGGYHVYLVQACPGCDGSGVAHEGADRNLAPST